MPRTLLACHREAQAFLRRDEVVGVLGIGPEVDLDPADGARECAVGEAVVVADRCAPVGADVGRLVCGEEHRFCLFDTPLAHLGAIQEEGDGPPLASPPPS